MTHSRPITIRTMFRGQSAIIDGYYNPGCRATYYDPPEAEGVEDIIAHSFDRKTCFDLSEEEERELENVILDHVHENDRRRI